MYELKKNGKVFTSKSVGTGPSSYEKRIYRAAVSQRLTNTEIKYRVIQEEKSNIFGHDSVSHCEGRVRVNLCLILNGCRDEAV